MLGKDEGREEACSRWLLSKCLSSIILSSMADLQGALARTGKQTRSHINTYIQAVFAGGSLVFQ